MTSSRGMTLIEVLMAVALLGIGAVFLVQSFATITRALDVAQAQTDAYGFSVSKMEELKSIWRSGRSFDSEGSFQAHHRRFLWQAAIVPQDSEVEFSPISVLTFQVQWDQRGLQTLEWSTLLQTPVPKGAQ